MFAVVRTGGKQYRVAPGDKIVVEKLEGNAGDRITLGDVLLAGNGSELQSTDGLTVAAELVAQAKADKVTVFKKRRRHNYRRKKGHRQQHTILRIVAVGDQKEQKPAPKAEAKAAPKTAPAPTEAPAKAAAPAKPPKPAKADTSPAKVDVQPTENPAPDNPEAANAPKPASKKDKPTAETPSTKNAAPAKGAAKKSPKAK
jgi:large subunit ribosomal protein L21